jgi:hypothetical protein
MGRSLFDQETQVHSSGSYDDTVSPSEANFETNPTELQTDLNCLRSMCSHLLDVQAGNWYDQINTPSTFEGGAQRGVSDLNSDLHNLERKRILKRRPVVGADIGPITTNAQHVVLGSGELPGNTTAAIGAVTTLGTVCATATSFDTAGLDEVAGSSALRPKNLCLIIDATSGDAILDSGGHEVYGLFQSESSTDGSTITATTPNRAQISFVVRNDTSDDLELVSAGDMDGKTIDYAPVERYALDDVPEESWLGDDYVDVGAAANIDRQTAYDNQGTTPVDLTTNATLDLEGAGLIWSIRDDAEANLFVITEGSSGGTSEVEIAAGVDVFDVNAVAVTFDSGITVNDGSGGTDIAIGTTAGTINTTGSDDLEIEGAGELLFDDGNRSGSTYSTAIKLSDTSGEWDNFESEFGEVSLLNAIVQAKQDAERSKGIANVSAADISANTLITGAAGSPNISAQLPNYNALSFTDDVEIYINGQLQRPGADAAANNDVYPSAVTLEKQQGAFYCEYGLKYRGGTNPDIITMIVWGTPT